MNHFTQKLLPFALLFSLAGCATNTALTARQIESGGVVFSGAIEEPGSFFIPRVSGQATYGFGPGDISAHLGISVAAANTGLTTRFYLGSGLALSLDSDITYILLNEIAGDDIKASLWSTSLRLLTTPSARDDAFYFGLTATALGSIDWKKGKNKFGAVSFGPTLGVEAYKSDSFNIQIEATIRPIGYGADHGFYLSPFRSGQADVAEGLFTFAQIGISIHSSKYLK